MDRNCPLTNKLRGCINLHEELNPPKTHAGKLLSTLRRVGYQTVAKTVKKDSPYERYTLPPPWQKTLFVVNYTHLPVGKHLCTLDRLQEAARVAIEKTRADNIYYTDGSVDREVPAAAAAVFSDSFKGNWRLSNHASTLQTELVAVSKAVEDSLHKNGSTTIHIDSMGAIQALTAHEHPRENVYLITKIWAAAQTHCERNRTLTLNWIPSHIQIEGNEEADRLAKSGLNYGTISIKTVMSMA